MPNPYSFRPVTAAKYFVAKRGGRGALARRLLQNIRRAKPLPDSLSIVGERRFGKTSLLRYLQQAATGSPNLLSAYVDLLSLRTPNAAGFYEMLDQGLHLSDALRLGQAVLDYDDFRIFLNELDQSGRHLVVFIDEFDLVARDRQFDWGFFDNLRSLATLLPLVLVVASVKPLSEIAHSGVYGSPFFNFFLTERLGLLSQAEVTALVGQGHFDDTIAAEIITLAGGHPHLLQQACSLAYNLSEAVGGPVTPHDLRIDFLAKTGADYQYIWDHSSATERQMLCALTSGARAAGAGLNSLIERGYVMAGNPPQPFGTGLLTFIQSQCANAQPPQAATGQSKLSIGGPLLQPMRVNVAAQPHRLALVIGVNQYQYQSSADYFLPSLQYAERDAEDMAQLLKELGFSVTCLLGTQATRSAFDLAFADFQQFTATEPHPESCFVFHFSGHGEMDPKDNETAYLVLFDTDPGQPGGAGVGMFQLVHECLPRVRVPNSLVLLDACHAGLAAGVKNLIPAHRLRNLTRQLFTEAQGRMVLAACSGEAQAREFADLQHGVFTYYILKHWRDLDDWSPPDPITFLSLVNYVTRVIPNKHPGLPLPVWNATAEGPPLTLRRVDKEILD